MALLIDTPRWPWRGRLWAHLISDSSLDELHDAARSLNLPWVSFGRDHYDVPDLVWPAACEMATLVDSRDIVRSLRRTGLRVPGGKPQKAWKRIESLPSSLAEPEVVDWLAQVRSLSSLIDVDVLGRPGECVVFHSLPLAERSAGIRIPDAPAGGRIVETVSDRRWSVELVFANVEM